MYVSALLRLKIREGGLKSREMTTDANSSNRTNCFELTRRCFMKR